MNADAFPRNAKLRVSQAVADRLAEREHARGARDLAEVQDEILRAGLDALDGGAKPAAARKPKPKGKR